MNKRKQAEEKSEEKQATVPRRSARLTSLTPAPAPPAKKNTKQAKTATATKKQTTTKEDNGKKKKSLSKKKKQTKEKNEEEDDEGVDEEEEEEPNNGGQANAAASNHREEAHILQQRQQFLMMGFSNEDFLTPAEQEAKRDAHIRACNTIKGVKSLVEELEKDTPYTKEYPATQMFGIKLPGGSKQVVGYDIKVNLPKNENNFDTGNGEGCFVTVCSRVNKLWSENSEGGIYLGKLNNFPVYPNWCYLKYEDPILFEMRGDKRPVAFLDQLGAMKLVGKKK